MRTTIRINDELLRQAKQQAARDGTTLTAIIEESLREKLSRDTQPLTHRGNTRLPTSGSGGLQPGIDLDDSAALLDMLDKAT